MIHLVTFSDENMMRAASLCIDSAMTHGADTAHLYTKDAIADWPTVVENPAVFRQPENPKRAYAWFAWKPLIIGHAMAELRDGNYLIYSDCGVEFIDNQKYITDRMDQDVFLFANMWEHAHWCKANIIEVMWPIKGMVFSDARDNANWSRFGKQVQASVILFRVSDYSRHFVKEWLDWCLWNKGELVNDSSSWFGNHPEFQENRWDQAILTTLAYREEIKLHWWPAVYNRFTPGGPIFTYEKGDHKDTYPPLYHHHRLRDWEWRNVA